MRIQTLREQGLNFWGLKR